MGSDLFGYHDRSRVVNGPGGRMTWIYILQCGEGRYAPVKVGRSDDPAARAKRTQTFNPYEIKVVAKFRLPSHMERELHHRWAGENLRGEWFKPNDEMLEIIDWYSSGSGSVPVRTGLSEFWVSKEAA